jgi:hypothetical protein
VEPRKEEEEEEEEEFAGIEIFRRNVIPDGVSRTCIFLRRSRVNSVYDKLRTKRPRFDFRQRQRIFLFATASRPSLGPTQPPIQ